MQSIGRGVTALIRSNLRRTVVNAKKALQPAAGFPLLSLAHLLVP
jgi:hypothetical protein